MKEIKKVTSIKVYPSLINRAKIKAVEQGITLSELIEKAIDNITKTEQILLSGDEISEFLSSKNDVKHGFKYKGVVYQDKSIAEMKQDFDAATGAGSEG